MKCKSIHYFGFIGLGVMGQRMLGNMMAHKNFDVIEVWDPNPELEKALNKIYPNLIFKKNAASVISSENVDAIYIASPPASHAEHVLRTVKAGKVIFCEKPLGININESRELIKAVEKSGLANAINFPFVGSDAVALMKKKIENRSLGKIKGVDLKLHFSKWPRTHQRSANWLRYREQGGFVREVVSHFVFLIDLLFGPIKLNWSEVFFPQDRSLCEVKFASSLSSDSIDISFSGDSGRGERDLIEFTVWGSKTSLRLWDWYNLSSSSGEVWEPELTHIPDLRNECYIKTLNSLNSMMRKDSHNMAPLKKALFVQEVIEKILDSKKY